MPRPAPPTPPVGRELGVPFSEVEEPRTVVGEAPSRATAQQLIARYAALSSTAEEAAPPRPSWFRRVARFAQDDFRRAPKVVRLLVPALPLIAAATTFLDVDPVAPALSRSVAVAATSSPDVPEVSPPSAPLALPSSTVTIVRHAGRTLAAEAADAAARGERAQAIAIYLQLAREHPEDAVYASAARILIKNQERDRPGAGH
jgi:hypothetical protein